MAICHICALHGLIDVINTSCLSIFNDHTETDIEHTLVRIVSLTRVGSRILRTVDIRTAAGNLVFGCLFRLFIIRVRYIVGTGPFGYVSVHAVQTERIGFPSERRKRGRR